MPSSWNRLGEKRCSKEKEWKHVDALERGRATSKWSPLSGLGTLPCTSAHPESTAGSSEFGRAPRSENQQEFVDCPDHVVCAGAPRNAGTPARQNATLLRLNPTQRQFQCLREMNSRSPRSGLGQPSTPQKPAPTPPGLPD